MDNPEQAADMHQRLGYQGWLSLYLGATIRRHSDRDIAICSTELGGVNWNPLGLACSPAALYQYRHIGVQAHRCYLVGWFAIRQHREMLRAAGFI